MKLHMQVDHITYPIIYLVVVSAELTICIIFNTPFIYKDITLYKKTQNMITNFYRKILKLKVYSLLMLNCVGWDLVVQ